MCNDFGLTHSISDIEQAFASAGVPLAFQSGRPNLQPRSDIWPKEPALVARPAGQAVELASLKWGFQPARPKGLAVINFRGEGRAFGAGRCLVPASHFFEFTGDKPPKTKWRFSRPDGGVFCIAGFWRAGDLGWGESFTMLTVEPGPDVAPIHDRQIVVLDPEHWAGWLDPRVPAEGFLRPCPAGALKLERER
jgi:putative SOS response-associated peptidase YedK